MKFLTYNAIGQYFLTKQFS